MPKSNFVINVANENRIENLSLLPLFRVTKVEEFWKILILNSQKILDILYLVKKK